MAAPAEKPNTNKSLFSKRIEGIITPECRSLLGTLPYHKSYVYPYLFLYQGFWYAPTFLNGVLNVQKNFQPNHSDIILATFPKSGTTWLKALLFTLLNRSKHNPNSRDHPLLHHNPHDLVPFMELDLYINHPNPPNLSGFVEPMLFSTHIPFSSLPSSIKSSKCKIVYLCRNPKDTVISLWKFADKVTKSKYKDRVVPLEEVFDMFCRGMNMYGSFWEHTLEYWKASQDMPDKCLFIKYEEMKQQPEEQLRRVADFLGYDFTKEEEEKEVVKEILKLCGFDSLSKMEVNQSGSISFGTERASFFRRGEVGDWTNYLTKEMIQHIDRITEEKFRGSNLGGNYAEEKFCGSNLRGNHASTVSIFSSI